MIRQLFWAALILAMLFGGYNSWRLREVRQPPGVLVAQDPLQTAVEGAVIFHKGEYTMQAQARYHIRGRLLHRERYRSDASSVVSPLDFGLGWGPMSDTRVLEQIQFTQGVRFLNWRWQSRQPPIPFEVLNSHASNNHLIPADGAVFEMLNKMRVGQIVELSGYLVKVAGPGGFNWSGSLSRDDVGDGACEIMYVQYANVI